MHRFFVTEQSLAVGAAVDLTVMRHQLRRVLRLGPGDVVLLLDGQGSAYTTELLAVDDEHANGKVVQAHAAAGEPRVHLTLCQCALKADKLEWVLQKGTELGVGRFVPVVSERTIVRPAAKLLGKYDRWRTIVREAAEQSARGRLPELAQPVTWPEALREGSQQLGGESGPILRLLPWERAGGAPALAECVSRSVRTHQSPSRVCLLIGPEGGISDAEMDQAVASGWQAVSLGPRILRAETAALAAIAVTLAALGEMA